MKVEMRRLDNKRVAVLAADGFEHAELAEPARALRMAGARVRVLSFHRGKIRGMSGALLAGSVSVDERVADADAEAFDALFIPGGFIGPDLLRQSEAARALARTFDELGKPIATIGQGPWLLASADVVQGRTLAAWPGIRDDITHGGGVWKDEPVVRDQNWISSRGPQDLAAFVPALIDHFASIMALEKLGEEATHMDIDAISSPPYTEPLSFRMRRSSALPRVLAIFGSLALGALALRRLARA